MKDFNTFMYHHTLHHEKNFFCAVIVYKILVQKKYQTALLKTVLKIMANKDL